MKNVSVEMESDYIVHGMRQPRQLHARRAGIAASMVRRRGMPGRVRRDVRGGSFRQREERHQQ